MTARIAFYPLHTKFVNQREDIPDDARQVVYYSLAIGHHIGVMDCFSCLCDAPVETFRSWLDGLPDSPGRTKLEGVLRWGEIEINRSHVDMLQAALDFPCSEQPIWIPFLRQCLQTMIQEPAFYLMVKKHA